MTRAELISRVQTKLDEKSPFDEPQSLIAAAGDSSYDKVKPITMYIDDLLDEAANDCLRMLPLSLVGKDVQKLSLLGQNAPAVDAAKQVVVTDGVGVMPLSANGITHYVRLLRVRADGWKKEVTSFITSADSYYLVQQNPSTRGKLYKPVVAWVPESDRLELFSFPNVENSTKVAADVWYIQCNKQAGSDKSNPVKSPIDELIAIRCAELVCNIFGNQNAQVFQKEFTEKVNSVLQ